MSNAEKPPCVLFSSFLIWIKKLICLFSMKYMARRCRLQTGEDHQPEGGLRKCRNGGFTVKQKEIPN